MFPSTSRRALVKLFNPRFPDRAFMKDSRYTHSKPTDGLHQIPVQRSNRSAMRPPTLMRTLSTFHLLRSLMLGNIFTKPSLFNACMSIMSCIANSKSTILNPDRNPAIGFILRKLVYDQFCAGTTLAEVVQTIDSIKSQGYAGVILCPGRELLANDKLEANSMSSEFDQGTEAWLHLNLETLSLIGNQDYIGIKLTGAGQSVVNALAEGRPPPLRFLNAMDVLVQRADSQGSRIWIDAEQQALQPAIDTWVIELMRKFNVNGRAIISNTYQAYLKSCRQNLDRHLILAKEGKFTLGVKLVRGAYIAHDRRDRIWDTKEQTDKCYDEITHDLLMKKSLPSLEKLPDVELFLASHNAASVFKAVEISHELAQRGQPYSPIRYGQLQGMADEVSCALLQRPEAYSVASLPEHADSARVRAAPEVYKCFTWGTISDCMQYLIRRAVENQGGGERLKASRKELKDELKRRIFGIKL